MDYLRPPRPGWDYLIPTPEEQMEHALSAIKEELRRLPPGRGVEIERCDEEPFGPLFRLTRPSGSG